MNERLGLFKAQASGPMNLKKGVCGRAPYAITESLVPSASRWIRNERRRDDWGHCIARSRRKKCSRAARARRTMCQTATKFLRSQAFRNGKRRKSLNNNHPYRSLSPNMWLKHPQEKFLLQNYNQRSWQIRSGNRGMEPGCHHHPPYLPVLLSVLRMFLRW